MNHTDGGNIGAVTDTTKIAASTVPHARELIEFTDAAIGRDQEAMPVAREALLRAVGPEGLVDAAGVVGNFERMNRIADAGGLEVDAPVRVLTANLRSELGLDELASASRAKPPGAISKLIARFAIPLAARIFSMRS